MRRHIARLAHWASAVLASGLAAASASGEVLVDGVAAQVGNRIILVSEVMAAVGQHEARIRAAGANEQEVARLRAEGLERLIENRLIEKVVEDAELFASDAEIDETIEAIAAENGLTLEQLLASVSYHGLSQEQYRAQLKRDIERRKVLTMLVGSDVEVKDHQVRELYDELYANQPEGGETIHVRQLLRAWGESTGRDQESACGAVATARERIEAGASFAAVAAELSDVAPQSGGDIGWVHVDTIAQWMRDALDALEPGSVTSLIELPFACTILELVERRSFEPVGFEQAQSKLRQQIWEKALDERYREWMEELRNRNYVDRRGYFADAARLGDSTFPLGPPAPAPTEP